MSSHVLFCPASLKTPKTFSLQWYKRKTANLYSGKAGNSEWLAFLPKSWIMYLLIDQLINYFSFKKEIALDKCFKWLQTLFQNLVLFHLLLCQISNIWNANTLYLCHTLKEPHTKENRTYPIQTKTDFVAGSAKIFTKTRICWQTSELWKTSPFKSYKSHCSAYNNRPLPKIMESWPVSDKLPKPKVRSNLQPQDRQKLLSGLGFVKLIKSLFYFLTQHMVTVSQPESPTWPKNCTGCGTCFGGGFPSCVCVCEEWERARNACIACFRQDYTSRKLFL